MLELKGFEALLRKLDPARYNEAYRRFWRRAAIAVQTLGREHSPVDTGRLRASLAIEVDPSPHPLWAKVGTNVEYGLPLDQPESRFPHYAAGVFAGAPTEGWLTDRPAEAGPQIEQALTSFGNDIESLWGQD